MKKQRKDSAETRRRLLDAAGPLFAAAGFRSATIAEICREAGVNVAAVNYHFKSKEGLYVEAWRHAFERSLATHPPDAGLADDAPAEERFRAQILSIVRRMADPRNCEFEIMHKELANPTGLLKKVMRTSIEPLQERLRAIVAELLGDGVTEEEIRLCQMSIRAQCFGPMLRRRRRERKPGCSRRRRKPEIDVDTLAEHVVRFSLAGIREMREGRAPRRRSRKKKGKRTP